MSNEENLPLGDWFELGEFDGYHDYNPHGPERFDHQEEMDEYLRGYRHGERKNLFSREARSATKQRKGSKDKNPGHSQKYPGMPIH